MGIKNQRLSKALFFSLLIHLMITLFLIFGSKTSNTRTNEQQISVEIINPSELKEKKSSPLEKAIQIVDQKTETNEPLNSSAKFLGEKNHRVQKETVATHRGEFLNSKNKGSGKNSASHQSTKNKLFKKILPSLIPQLGMGEFKVSALKELKFGSSLDKKITGSDGNRGSQTTDYLKNTERGIETLLNTREFKYHSYYSRIRRQLSQHWEGKVRDRVAQIYKSGRSIASNQDRITRLLVVLNSVGLLVKVQVLNDSGIYDLDQAAIEAFRDAAPFPNPPRGIIESDGTVKIRWDMVLET